MKRILRASFLSFALIECLNAVNATFWWQLDQANNPPAQPPNPPTITDPLRIYEDSVLSITTTVGQTQGSDLYNGNITFDHNLRINVNVDQQGANQSTTIYQGNNNGQKKFEGKGRLDILIDSTKNYAKSVFNLDKTELEIGVKTSIKMVDQSKLFSIFRIGAGSKLRFTNDLIVDVSNAVAHFPNQNPKYKTIFDNNGGASLFINPNFSTTMITQLTGDIADYGGTLTLNLGNAQSFFKGSFFVDGTGQQSINLRNGATAETTLDLNKATNFSFNLNSQSQAKVKTNFGVDKGVTLQFDVNNSSLFADFNYLAGTVNQAQGEIKLSNQGIWFLSQSNTIDHLEINNPKDQVNKDNLKDLKNLAAVDMRFKNQGAVLRDELKLDDQNRYTLKTSQIRGANGVFRIFGVLNQDGWTKKTEPNNPQKLEETIATDQIVTNQLFNTHYMQVFWNKTNFDKKLLNKNLEEHKIIVAKQENPNGGGDFVGAVTPIGVYNYITNLKKIPGKPNAQGVTGWEWIISDVQRADNSYLSRLLDSIFQSQYRIFKMESDTFNLRMGELRNMKRVHGVWLRTKYGRLKSKSTPQTTPSWDEFTSVWLGYDQNFYVLGGKNFLGLAFNTTAFRNHGIADKDDFSGESYYASSRSFGFSIYDTFFFDNGVYIDTLAKYYLTNNDMAINSEVLNGNYPKFFTHAFLSSIEVGKKFTLPIKTPDFANSFYYLRPELQFTFGFVSGTKQEFWDWTNQKIDAQLDFNIPANFRAGLMFGREFNKPFLQGDIYLGTSFEYDVNSGGDLRLEDFLDKMTLTHGGNFNWRINMGTNLILNQYWRLYFDLDTSFFGQINSTFTINGGVRINFGRLHPVMPYVVPESGVFDPDMYRKDRRTIPEVQNYETQGILDNYSGIRKKKIYRPPVKIKQRAFGGTPMYQTPPKVQVKPSVKAPSGDPTFIDNPKEVLAPQKNYTREPNPAPNVQTPRSLEGIKEEMDRGYRR